MAEESKEGVMVADLMEAVDLVDIDVLQPKHFHPKTEKLYYDPMNDLNDVYLLTDHNK